ncbi:hypothetical protein [Piscinibacter sp. HJYY11]|uniref:hypothetical protein n=1 Tax=Piscinibacter sp. HJYY11 TaxID=2801333 RepID=UPI00191D7216|nr:hypothetical protein [Piscinibacter sp. HJYY11]MBL0728595.1 hypothetical protein [Piscinibacter sp. HJYY11]
MKSMLNLLLHAAVAVLVLLSLPALAQTAPAAAAKTDPVVLLKQATGQDAASLKDFLADQGAASVSAAALAGIGTTPLTVVQDTKDFAVLLSPFGKEGKGGGFVITPARVRNPLPRIDLMTEYVPSVWWRIAAATNISGAQGKGDIGGKEYRRRAFAIATGAYIDKDDDPIYQRAVATVVRSATGELVGDACFVAFDNAVNPKPGDETGTAGASMIPDEAKATATYKACVEKVYADSRNRWFAPRWSLALGTGDAQPTAGGESVRIGDVVVLGVTYGRPWRTTAQGAANPAAAGFLSGWAITLVARHTRKEPVLASLSTGPVQYQDTTLLVGRLAAGTESWRLMLEASDNDQKKAAGGERTLKQAVGLDWRVAKDTWLNVRYGKRDKATGSGDEGAALLSLTLGGDLLTF